MTLAVAAGCLRCAPPDPTPPCVPCGYICRQQRAIESVSTIHRGFREVNQLRLRPECSGPCDAALTAILGVLQAVACGGPLSEEVDRRWRLRQEKRYTPFECEGPPE